MDHAATREIVQNGTMVIETYLFGDAMMAVVLAGSNDEGRVPVNNLNSLMK